MGVGYFLVGDGIQRDGLWPSHNRSPCLGHTPMFEVDPYYEKGHKPSL